MLPLEAIELDAFRHRHEHHTFWCGLLLGGCGGQLTTKLYTDRVCHFAHHPDPDGLPQVCGRHARGVASADHLYVKSAAAAWLRGRGEQPRFDYARPGGAAIGSVVDIQWRRGGLRVHLDQAVTPEWDVGTEPVLGMSVSVDRDTLIRRWYIHRIRLESEGTARRVRIGTEAFARPTEWFALDECEMTERGLSTPAVERIIHAHRTPPPSRWTTGKAKKAPTAQVRARTLIRRLADARRLGSVVVASRVCREIAALKLTGVEQATQAELAAAVEEADRWLEEQARARRALFSRLNDAVHTQKTKQVRDLLVRVNATASQGRTEAEDAIVEAATDHVAALVPRRQAQAAPRRETGIGSRAAHQRVRNILDNLRRRDVLVMTDEVRDLVKVLLQAAAEAGTHVADKEAGEVAGWQERAGLATFTPAGGVAAARAAAAQRMKNKQEAAGERPKQKRSRPDRVARRFWIQNKCPRCHAGRGKNCVNDTRSGTGEVRKVPHAERVKPIVEERKGNVGKRRLRATDITCPDCRRPPGSPCASPNGGAHRSRVERAQARNTKNARP
ncbi:hypothetical protein [Streptomyces sp. NPDC047525]|uniref:zinc finger domain-containing protein n=1 Tax=Streptomyces sp. NPDC047525 TaxID=3155264 RepID=UPI0033CD719E